MEKQTTVKTLSAIALGESVVFPAEKLMSVKSTCTQYGWMWDKKFSVKTNPDRTFTVTRIK